MQPTPHQAQIIAFPAPNARLTSALANLQQALEEQARALAAWRESLGQLKQTVTHLGASMADYRQNLATLATDVAQLQHTAENLARITP